MSATLSPILSLFLPPSGKLYQKIQHYATEDEKAKGSNLPIVSRQRRPGPKTSAYGIPSQQWPTVLHRVLENQEPLRKVAAEYGVSHETVRRVILASQKKRAK